MSRKLLVVFPLQQLTALSNQLQAAPAALSLVEQQLLQLGVTASSSVLVLSVSFTCSRMRVLWTSLLLLGSITCDPPQPGSGGGRPWWSVSSSGYDPYDEKPAGLFRGSGSYSSSPGQYYSSTNTAGGSSYMVQQQSGPQDHHHGAPGSSGPYQSTEESWSSSSDTSGEDKPVFSPVEDQDEVYAFKSRSRYNRLSFNQFHYTPTKPRFSREPEFHHGQKHQPHHAVKGGY